MKNNKRMIGILAFILSLLLLVGLLPLGTVSAQEPRPTVAPPTPRADGGDDPGSTSSDSDSGEVSTTASDRCASVFGTALNWGYGEQGDVGIRLYNEGWQQKQVTGNDGRYNFGALGSGVGILSVESPNLNPMINNAAVRLSCQYHIHANIGLYSSDDRPTPPGQIALRTSQRNISPGDSFSMILSVRNTLPDPMSQIVVTDLFPEGLTIEEVSSSMGQVEVLEGRMLSVFIDSLPSLGRTDIQVSLRASRDLDSNTQLENRATLFYAESAADQSEIVLNVAAPAARQPVMVESAPQAEPAAAVADNSTSDAESLTTANKATKTDSDDSPPPEPGILPQTGVGVTLTALLLLTSVLALLVYGFQSVKRA